MWGGGVGRHAGRGSPLCLCFSVFSVSLCLCVSVSLIFLCFLWFSFSGMPVGGLDELLHVDDVGVLPHTPLDPHLRARRATQDALCLTHSPAHVAAPVRPHARVRARALRLQQGVGHVRVVWGCAGRDRLGSVVESKLVLGSVDSDRLGSVVESKLVCVGRMRACTHETGPPWRTQRGGFVRRHVRCARAPAFARVREQILGRSIAIAQIFGRSIAIAQIFGS